MEVANCDLTFQYEQNINNLLFIVKNILKTYEEEQELNIDMYMPHLKEYYEEVISSQNKIKNFRQKIEKFTY